jgi:hypothetical protein
MYSKGLYIIVVEHCLLDVLVLAELGSGFFLPTVGFLVVSEGIRLRSEDHNRMPSETLASRRGA